jgi:hypothetical protein
MTIASKPSFVNPPALEYKISNINGLAWKRHYAGNIASEFKFPNTIPTPITTASDFSVAVTGITGNKGWYNVPDDVIIRLYDTEDETFWRELGQVTLRPGLYRTPFEFSEMFNEQMDAFALAHNLQRCPQTLAKFENDHWSCVLWPARYSTFVPDGPFGRERVKDFNICMELPLMVCRFLGLDDKYQRKEAQGHETLIESTRVCNMAPVSRMVQLHSNLKPGPLIDFDCVKGDMPVIADELRHWVPLIGSNLGEDLCFWFTDVRGQSFKTDELISLELTFSKTIKEGEASGSKRPKRAHKHVDQSTA